MAYLSRIKLEPKSPELSELAKLALGDIYREHQLVWRFFPDMKDHGDRRPKAEKGTEGLPKNREDAPFLYRREGEGSHSYFYIVSKARPQPDSLLWQCDTKDYDPQLAEGDRLAFTLRANPTQVYDGKRYDLVAHRKKQLTTEQGESWKSRISQSEILMQVAEEWLTKRAKNYGYEINAESLIVEGYQRLNFQSKDRREIVLGALDVRGELAVSRPDDFRNALLGGIGRAQGFGMGLMLVRRVV